MNEKSFPVYLDTEPIISMLTDEQLGQVFRALYPYWNDGEMIVTCDNSVRMAFTIFANKLDLARASSERYKEMQRLKRRIGVFKGKSDEKENAAKELLTAFNDYHGSITDFQREYRKAYEEIGIMIEIPDTPINRSQPRSTAVNHGQPKSTGGDLNITEYNLNELNPIEGNITEKGSGAENRPEPVFDSDSDNEFPESFF